MAVIKDTLNPDNTVNYIATLAFFCCVSCVTLMLKFRGFKASLNFYHGKKKETSSEAQISMTGAYRTNRDEFFGYNNNIESQRRLTPTVRPSALTESTDRPLGPAKSTSDLIKNKNLPPSLRLSSPNVSNDPRGTEPANLNDRPPVPKRERPKLDAERKVEKQKMEEQKKQEKQRIEEQKKLEKQRAEEQKKREKQAAQEQAKQEKLRKEQEKKAQQGKRVKKKAPAPAKPLANPLAQAPTQQSTNTLESSISRSSGPPPYSPVPKDLVQNEADATGNVSFSKPIDTGSWDLITEHRQQITRTVNSTPNRKQMVMDLNYSVDHNADENRGNSEA